MGKHAQLVIGPAGCGKSTYCKTIAEHCQNIKRSVHIVNLDPAAEEFEYEPSIDIRDLISLDDVMEELQYGPNGGLIYCMEYLIENIDWLQDEIADYDDDYLLIDCPGQIELYSHIPVMKTLTDELQKMGYNICAVYCLDSTFLKDASKFIAGTFMCLSAMIQLELPHINVLTKVDLLSKEEKRKLEEEYLIPDCDDLVEMLNKSTSKNFKKLNKAIASVISQYSLVSFTPLDISDEESIGFVLAKVDHCIQYGEDLEPKEPPKALEEFDID